MRPHRFLDLAEELAGDSGPAKYRSAISRAYYAVYNVAELFLDKMKFQRPKRDYHVVLQRRLLASKDPELEQVGSNLGDFHQERIHADYRMDNLVPESKNNAEAAVIKAKEMIAVFDNCPLYGIRWKQIQTAIAKANITGYDDQVIASGS